MKYPVTITVSGPTGSGKPILIKEIKEHFANAKDSILAEILPDLEITYVEHNPNGPL